MASGGYRDYFRVLGVERSADSDTIKRAFRKLARQYHPDVNPGDKESEAKFKEINEAYEVLSDDEKRRKYEQFGQYWNKSPGIGGPSGNSFDVDFGRYGNFDEFINDLLGRFGGAKGTSGFPGAFSTGGFTTGGPGFSKGSNRSSMRLDAEVDLKVGFLEALHGSERTLAVNAEKVQVRIPKGIRQGAKLRLKGKGNLDSASGFRGDLYLHLSIQDHPVWNLDGINIKGNLPVSFDEIALGCNVKVITPDGEAKVIIPAGTSPGRCLRLKGKGWPSSNGRGDLLLTLKIHVPDQWSNEEIEILNRLKDVRSFDPRVSWIETASL